MKFFKYIFTALIFFCAVSAQRAFAGSVYIEQQLPKSATIRMGDEVLIDIKINSQNTEYNAIEGQLSIPAQFSIKEVITGNSFITFWLENPQDYHENTINFSGITPSGYNNQNGDIFSIILKAQARGFGNVVLENLKLYKNDGLGTAETKEKIQKSVTVSNLPKGAEPYLISINDTNKPTIAKAELVREYNLYDGDWALVFLGVDKGSGIETFNVVEGSKVFENITSPYRIDHQRLNKKISLVAIDGDGNTETVSVNIPHKFCVGNDCYGIVEAVLLVVILTATLFYVRKRHRKRIVD